MSAEIKYNEIVKRLNIDIKNAVRNANDSVHSEIIPYINDDTEHNAVHRSVDIVNKIMRGDFTVDGNYIKVDGWTLSALTNYDHNKLVDALAEKAGDKAKDLKIERLERLLQEAYEGKY